MKLVASEEHATRLAVKAESAYDALRVSPPTAHSLLDKDTVIAITADTDYTVIAADLLNVDLDVNQALEKCYRTYAARRDDANVWNSFWITPWTPEHSAGEPLGLP